jgi:S1-C subfamily serine protease
VERSEWADDDQPYRQPLPPEDRLWRHPSELGTPVARVAAPTPASVGRGRLLGAFAAGAVGALLVSAGITLLLSRDGGSAGAGGATVPFSFTSSTLGAPATTVVSPATAGEVPATVPTASPTTLAPASGLARSTTSVPVDQQGVLRLIAVTPGGERAVAAVAVEGGLLVTTAAGVRDAASITVLLPDGRTTSARVLGTDAEAGTAVLAADAPIDPARTGRAADLEPGETVRLASAPSRTGTVTKLGVHTSTGQGATLKHMVAVDLPDGTPTHEGDALVDDGGDVVAICTMAADGHAVGVPIEIARGAARSLGKAGRIMVPWLGVGGSDSEAPLGASVQEVQPDTPAAAAGITPGDVVVAVDGTPVSTMASLVLAVRDHTVGDLVTLTVRTGDAERAVVVTLAERPPGA